jgi:uncharacterized membrane protein YdjX (TVP38/TMEM64 family)
MKDHLTLKKIIKIVWILFLIFCTAFILTNSELFKPQILAAFLIQFKTGVLAAYFIISLLRGFTLVPSTPLVLAGTILYPNEPFLILAISLTGIIFSSTMIYYFSDYLGFGASLERKHPRQIAKIHDQLQKPTGILFVFLWSFLPVLPTDAVCYAAGILRMNFTKFILAMTFGELILCSIYIFFYSYLLNFIQTFS